MYYFKIKLKKKLPVMLGLPKGDAGSIVLLFVLYTLQGVPMGLSGSIPFILNEREDVTMSQMAMFSLVSWPFSLKILWAPLVDSIYLARVGRRKTWIVPTQLIIGGVMLALGGAISARVNGTAGSANAGVDVKWLTVVFFGLYFLCATQDIAVDGWALTMLSKANVGWAATCNSAGQAFGFALSYTGLLILLKYELLTFAAFIQAWGAVFLLVTCAVAFLKAEQRVAPSRPPASERAASAAEVAPLFADGAAAAAAAETDEEETLSMCETFAQIRGVVGLPAVRQLLFVLFTCKVPFVVIDQVAPLRLQKAGVSKATLALFSALISPCAIALPPLLSRCTAGRRPFAVFMAGYPLRLVAGLAIAALVGWCTHAGYGAAAAAGESDGAPLSVLVVSFAVNLAYALIGTSMFVSQMAFFNRVSDPRIGGSYMTLLNTMANLGYQLPSCVARVARGVARSVAGLPPLPPPPHNNKQVLGHAFRRSAHRARDDTAPSARRLLHPRAALVRVRCCVALRDARRGGADADAPGVRLAQCGRGRRGEWCRGERRGG